MASGLHLLCHKAGGNALCYKAGGSSLIYKWMKSGGGGGGGGETTRHIVISVLWDPINWVCGVPESHLMYCIVRCSVASGAASLRSSNTTSVGENIFRYDITQFPASFSVSMGFSASCVQGKFPDVTASVVANCKTTEQFETSVQIMPNGSASKTVYVAVDESGNISMG